MKKFAGILSWIVAILGTVAILVTELFIDNYIVFYGGWITLIIGIIGVLLTCKKTKKFIFDLLDLI